MLRPSLLCVLLSATQAGWCTRPNDTLSIERAVTRYNISTPLLSPDASKAIVSISPAVALPDSQVSHLWLLDLRTKEFRQFTSSAKSESNPRWSPDGKKLAFVSARNGSAQIFLLPMDGGEALPLTQSKTGIRSYEWAPDGKSIVYIAQDELADSLKKRRDQKFDETVVGESTRATIIWRTDLDTRKVHQLTKQLWNIYEMKWLPSGKELLLLYATLPEEELEVPKLVRFNLGDSSFKPLASPSHGNFYNFVLSPNGKTAAFSSAREIGPIAHDLFIHQLDTNAYGNVTGKTLDRIVHAYKFRDNHTLLGLVGSGFDTRLYTIKDNGEVSPYPLKENIQSFDVAQDGTLVYVGGTFTQLPEVYVVQPGGQPEKVSSIHHAFDSIRLVTPKIFTYKVSMGNRSRRRSICRPMWMPMLNSPLLPISMAVPRELSPTPTAPGPNYLSKVVMPFSAPISGGPPGMASSFWP